MEIRRVHVSAFKSLSDVEAIFDQFTVVTGPNGAGKSNLVDALTFVGDAYRHGLEFAISHAGGYENIAHRRSRRATRPVSFSVTVEILPEELSSVHTRYLFNSDKTFAWPPNEALFVQHSFSIRAASQKLFADFELVRESFVLRDRRGNEGARLERERGADVKVRISRLPRVPRASIAALLRPFSDKGFTLERWGRPLDQTELAFTLWRYVNVMGLVSEHLASIKVFQLSPHLSRTSGVATPNAELGLHGENLPGAADNLRRRNSEAWKQVEAAMRTLMPGLASISVTPTEDRRLALQFREHGVGRPWNASELSDGTIQMLALLVALFDRRASMLVIEEPENAVHPWILRQLIDLARDVSRQMLFTTHSPVLLDYVDPSIVWLMWMRGGRSTLRKIVSFDPEITDGLVSGRISIFELYDSGYFREAVPRGLTDLDGSQGGN